MKLLLISLFASSALAIWPIPSSLSTGNSTLWIDEGVAITYNGPSHVGFVHLQDVFNQYAVVRNTDRIVPQTASYSSNGNTTSAASSLTAAVIQAAISRTSRTLFQQNFLPWKFHPRNTNFPSSPNPRVNIRSITLQQTQPDPATLANPHAGDIDESYSLTVTESGEVTVTGASSFGIAHGLTTFTQLFYQSSYGGIYTPYAPVSIKDAPLFPHRGLNMDLSRNWFAMSDIERMIDAMAYNKFNRMHLHITDSQSWPLQIPALPELASKGAYEASLSYSPAQIQQIQYYGFLQGVSVYLEVDSPGHTASIAYSHPELIASFNIQPNWDDFAAEPPSGTLKLNSPAVDDFMNTLYGDLLPRVKPYSAYFHTGGDEVNQNAYLNDDTVRSNETSVLQPLLQKFVDRNHAQIRANGMTPVVWEEMLLTWNLTLGSDVVVQTWISGASVASATSQGHYALAGAYEFWVSNFLLSLALANRESSISIAGKASGLTSRQARSLKSFGHSRTTAVRGRIGG